MELRPLFQAIAGAIREKDGSSEPIPAAEFPARIRAIPTAGILLRSLRITSPPAKTVYSYNGFGGETFDPAGMELEADLSAFDNSIALPIDPSYAAFEPSGPLTEGTRGVTVLFRFGAQTVTAGQPVSVQFRSPNWAELEEANFTWGDLEARFPTWDALENYGAGGAL